VLQFLPVERKISLGVFLLGLFSCAVITPRTVVPGHLYLSGQPRGGQCERWIRDLGIRSIVSLRDPAKGSADHLAEKACTDRAGIMRLDLPFMASTDPPRHMLERYIRRFPSLPEPILIHCHSGIDRSSLGAFLALMLWDRPFDEAASWVRDFGKRLRLKGNPQRRFVDGFEAWCVNEGRPPDRAALVDYVERAYCPEEFRFALEAGEPPAEATASDPVRHPVRVTNTGSRPWVLSAGPERGIRLGVRLYGPFIGPPADPEDYYYDHRNEGWDACRAGMEEGGVAVGASRDWTLVFAAPAAPGLYLMAVDMVEEHRAWFSDYGRPPRLSFLRVAPPAAPDTPPLLP
jgi:predicted protein tyrosine phosphatase